MYDSFNFSLSQKYFDYEHVKKIFEEKMKFKQDTTYPNGKALIVNHENYAFSLSENYLKATGSLTKWYAGDNVQNINYSQVQEALMKFETIFEIPFDNAIVHRIDIALNGWMKNRSVMYLDLITDPIGYEKTIRDKSKLYEGTRDDLYFYDKVAALKTKKQDALIFEQHKYDNIFRYEIRFVNNLVKKLGLKDATFKNFYDLETYELLLNKWYNGYKDVPKLTVSKPLVYDASSLTAIKDSTINKYIQLIGGVEVYQNDVFTLKPHKQVKYKFNQYLTALDQAQKLSPDLLVELDNKIDGLYYQQLGHLNNIRQWATVN